MENVGNDGTRLREARKRAGLTQAELAERVGSRQKHISRYEADAHALDTAQAATVLKIARALGTTVEELLAE